MYIVLDIATSGFHGSILSLTNLFLFERPVDTSNGGSQALFIEKGWFFDKCIGMGEKWNKENRVYDIMDVCRLVSDPLDPQVEKRSLMRSFRSSKNENGDVDIIVQYRNEEHHGTLSQLIGEIITYLHRLVSMELKVPLNGYCILFPGDFGAHQFDLFHRAAEDAHFYQVRLVDERIASIIPYLYYGGVNRQDATVLLLDYGASSLSLSFISIWKGHVRIRDSKILSTLSGRHIDTMIKKYISRKYRRLCGISITADVKDTDLLMIECENAKIALSTGISYELQIQSLGAQRNIILTRRELDALLLLPLWLLERELTEALHRLNWRSEFIDSVIAIGGNAKIPAVKQLLLRLFPFSEHDYASSISHPASLGGNLISEYSELPTPLSTWCYRVRVNDRHFLVVGRSLQCLTKDVMLIPIQKQGKEVTSVIRILVERCRESDLLRALSMPYEPTKRGLWEYVFGYHYSVSFKSLFTLEDSLPLQTARGSEEEPEVLKQDCLEVEAQVLEDERMILSMVQIHQHQYVISSRRSFAFKNGKVIESCDPCCGVITERTLFSSRLSTYKPSITHLTTCTSSNVLSTLLNDRTLSPIILIDPSESDVSIAGDQQPFYLTCPNRHLRTRNMPELLNLRCDLTRSASRTLVALNAASTNRLKKEELPPFQKTPRTPSINRLFFLGPEPTESPLSACCYMGTFFKGVPHGKGREFSVSHETVYQGEWKEGLYHGEGTLWRKDGCRLEGTFVNGYLEGTGTVFRANGSVSYHGRFVEGKRDGEGIEYEEDGAEYEGRFREDRRDGHGLLSRDKEVLYDGEWMNGLKHGQGREMIGQTAYEGDFKQGLRDGKGRLMRLNGQLIYSGDWVMGKRHGNGKEILKGGIVYEGSFRDDRCEGKGKQLQDGVLLYEGDFVNGLREGHGRLYNKDGSVSMEGSFKKGRLNGEGTIYHGNANSFYMGSVVDDKPNGKGTEVLPSGEFYEGDFLNGRWHGQGRWYNERKALVYTGNWLYGVKHGYGEFQDDRGLFVGEFIKGVKCGNGKYTFFSGDQYIGEFAEDRFNGKGRYINAAGKVTYDGEWRNGKRCGIGKMYFGNGEYYHGMFHDDFMCGRGVYYYENGIPSFVGEFRNDMRNGEGISYDVDGSVLERGFYVNNVHVANSI